MKNLKFFAILAFFVTPLMFSCGDDDPDDGNVNCNDSFSINAELQGELNAANAAVTAYSNDPSTANCETMKAAWQDYLQAAEAIQDCANQAGQGTEYAQAIQGAMDSIDAIPC